MRKVSGICLGFVTCCLALSVQAQQPVIYPAKGQSASQQGSDEGACHVWAKQNTGIDPALVAQTPPPTASGSTLGSGHRAQGALRGALGGAAIGAIGGDAGKGAGVGAVVGTMAGGHRARQQQQAQNQQAVGQQQQQIDTYYRAYGACLEGRGYVIK